MWDPSTYQKWVSFQQKAFRLYSGPHVSCYDFRIPRTKEIHRKNIGKINWTCQTQNEPRGGKIKNKTSRRNPIQIHWLVDRDSSDEKCVVFCISNSSMRAGFPSLHSLCRDMAASTNHDFCWLPQFLKGDQNLPSRWTPKLSNQDFQT